MALYKIITQVKCNGHEIRIENHRRKIVQEMNRTTLNQNILTVIGFGSMGFWLKVSHFLLTNRHGTYKHQVWNGEHCVRKSIQVSVSMIYESRNC